jgi:hypothetical protein
VMVAVTVAAVPCTTEVGETVTVVVLGSGFTVRATGLESLGAKVPSPA